MQGNGTQYVTALLEIASQYCTVLHDAQKHVGSQEPQAWGKHLFLTPQRAAVGNL